MNASPRYIAILSVDMPGAVSFVDPSHPVAAEAFDAFGEAFIFERIERGDVFAILTDRDHDDLMRDNGVIDFADRDANRDAYGALYA